MIGLKKGIVKFAPYDKEWEVFFEKEKILLQKTLGPAALDIQHVGSTSVPGMSAKPIIDIALGIKALNSYKQYIVPLQSINYIFKEHVRLKNDYYFAKGNEEEITCHLHLVKYQGEIWKNYLAFRNYLRVNPQSVREYIELKETLRKKFPENRKKYTAGKSKFISSIIKTARATSNSL